MFKSSHCKKVVILGGGTAGWMSAAALAYRLKDLNLDITLIEAPDIGTIGVGEATVPAIKKFFQSLDLNIPQMMAATNATFKLGIEFENWRNHNHSFFHPFGLYGVGAGEIDFAQIFQMLKNSGDTHTLKEYSLGTKIAFENRFGMPNPNPNNDFEVFDWAIHFDANLFAKFLKDFAISHGIKHISAKVNETIINSQSGDISALKLDNGDQISGQLFIDCSGIRAVLMQGALKTGYNDWGNYLLCDRAIAIGCSHKEGSALAPYTRSRAQNAGWTWRIPLQNRIGNGYVYSSQFINDDNALEKLINELDTKPINEPNLVKYATGHSKKIWNKNCIAIGLSAGFLEPLESTSISLIQIGIDKLISHWPNEKIDPRIVNEYNRVSIEEYERIRDFIILHYKLNARQGEKFWDHCRNMEIPEALSIKIDGFAARGKFVNYNWESFFDPSWHAMYEGFGIEPEALNPMCALLDFKEIQQTSQMIRDDIEKMAALYPSHIDFIKKNCASADFKI